MPASVLFVDDDPNILQGLIRSLCDQPWELLLAQGPRAALEVLGTRTVDVIVSDEGMPGMSGTALLAHVREAYPDTMRILLTGRGSLELAIRAINQGEVFRFLTKPCDPGDLAGAIRQALQHKELVCGSRRLVEALRRQAGVLGALDPDAEAIGRVERDASGAVLVSSEATDLDALLKEVEDELAAADTLMARYTARRAGGRGAAAGSGRRSST